MASKTKKPKHRHHRPQTPTPWSVWPSAIGERAYIGRPNSPDGSHGVFARTADARRSVLCVNACAGLTDEQLSSLPGTILELLKTLNGKILNG